MLQEVHTLCAAHISELMPKQRLLLMFVDLMCLLAQFYSCRHDIDCPAGEVPQDLPFLSLITACSSTSGLSLPLPPPSLLALLLR
jgi:hypothetical protein